MDTCTISYDDRRMITDALSGQKFMTGNYNNYLGESAHSAVRDAFLTILKDEHEIQHMLFEEMHSHGWYPTTPADKVQIDNARTQFKSNCTNC